MEAQDATTVMLQALDAAARQAASEELCLPSQEQLDKARALLAEGEALLAEAQILLIMARAIYGIEHG